ncbi:MAG: M20 family metallo-hydrolase [Alphaproteobacteria bacterium]
MASNSLSIDGDRLLADLRELAQIGKVGTGVRRLSFGAEDVEARGWLQARMSGAGLDATIDGIGNVVGRMPGVDRAILIGSHTDTVPSGGWLDGAMGVIFGLELARTLHASGVAGLGIDVISFADEEGTFVGTTGAKSLCGELPDDALDAARDADGTSLRNALAKAGWADRPPCRLDPDRHVAYLEAHIEQGPRLEAAGLRIGIVTAIVGMRRMRVRFFGRNDHAGTTPMAMRQDAGSALLRFGAAVLQRFEQLAGPETVWNVGAIRVEPGAANVVQSVSEMIVEYRDRSDAQLDRMEQALQAIANEAAKAAQADVGFEPVMRMAPAEMDASLADHIEQAAAAQGVPTMRMQSGAGHDAMVLARHVPTAMLFVPSIGGRSHDLSEDTDEADIRLGCQVLADAVSRIIAAENEQ